VLIPVQPSNGDSSASNVVRNHMNAETRAAYALRFRNSRGVPAPKTWRKIRLRLNAQT
jgi:hypothetical protein